LYFKHNGDEPPQDFLYGAISFRHSYRSGSSNNDETFQQCEGTNCNP